MSNVFFTADTHFSHQSMIDKGWRPFSSVDEMNETLVDRWNSVVTKRDQVWHLGDVHMSTDTGFFNEILPRLKGQINLITGNHDSCFPGHRNSHTKQREWIMHGFNSVQSFARRKIGRASVMLSHFPYKGDHTEGDRYNEYRLQNVGMPLIHGHVHDEWLGRDLQINVGVDMWDWTPVPLDYLKEMVNG